MTVASRLSVLGMVSILYLAFVGAVVLGFSGYILRINFERDLATPDGGLDQLLFVVAQEEAYEADLEAAIADILVTARQVGVAKATQHNNDFAVFAQEAAMLAEFSPVSLSISEASDLFDLEYAKKFREVLYDGEMDNFTRMKLLTSLIATPNIYASIGDERAPPILEKFRETSKQLALMDKDLLELQKVGTISAEELTFAEEARTAAVTRRDALQAGLEALRAREIYGKKAKIVSLKSSPYLHMFYRLIQIPTIILTMIVTIAAGGLGSVVAFTRGVLFEREGSNVRLLYVSVGEGVAAAVAIFFLAGAGMLMLSTGGGANGAAEISPYMVAFLAFVSGFMAEDAFKSIQRAGRNLFSESKNAPVPAVPANPQQPVPAPPAGG